MLRDTHNAHSLLNKISRFFLSKEMRIAVIGRIIAGLIVTFSYALFLHATAPKPHISIYVYQSSQTPNFTQGFGDNDHFIAIFFINDGNASVVALNFNINFNRKLYPQTNFNPNSLLITKTIGIVSLDTRYNYIRVSTDLISRTQYAQIYFQLFNNSILNYTDFEHLVSINNISTNSSNPNYVSVRYFFQINNNSYNITCPSGEYLSTNGFFCYQK